MRKIKQTEWFKQCDGCGGMQYYSTKAILKQAIKKNKMCYSCSNSGKTNPMYGVTSPNFGKVMSDERKRELSIANSGKGNPMYGKSHIPETIQKIKEKRQFQQITDETRIKLRKSHIERIEKLGVNVFPNYNPSSIPAIEEKAKELGITDLQHAENGGEFYIKELGYWVDGYSKEKNVVIEYYEPFHNKNIDRDKRRESEIKNYLNCKFIVIKENDLDT